MALAVPENYQLVYPKAAIAQKINELASNLTDWTSQVYDQTDQPVLAVCILRGAVFFYSDLLLATDAPLEPAFCHASAYLTESNELDEDGVRLSLKGLDPKGRAVLLIDDICDSGNTLFAIEKTMLEQGATAVKTAVLIRRLIDSPQATPTWSCFDYSGPEWFVGFGMDDRERFRCLPEVYKIS